MGRTAPPWPPFGSYRTFLYEQTLPLGGAMSPFGFKGSGDRYAEACAPFGLAPATASMLFGREKTDLRSKSEGIDTTRDIPHVLAGVVDGVPTEVFELRIRTKHESSDGTTEWREDKWLVAMSDVAERFPQIDIEPRGALGRFFKNVGYKGIETGDAAFDRVYHVGGHDHETALGILQPPVRAWLVAQRPANIRFELSGACILVAREDWGPDEAGTLLQVLRAFRSSIFAASGPTPTVAVAPPPPPVGPGVPPATATSSAAPGPRFCGGCGAPIVAGARFCASCGAAVAVPSA